MPETSGAAPSEELLQLSRRAGIDSEYHDIWGERHEVPASTLAALLRETGHATEDASTNEGPQQWRHALPPIVIVKEGAASFQVSIRLPVDLKQIQWRVLQEGGEVVHTGVVQTDTLPASEPRLVNDATVAVLYELDVPVQLPVGYHRFDVFGVAGDSLLACTPARCYQPPALTDGGRLWGIAVQLYGLRSQRNWGIGDFTDLGAFAAEAARKGASAIGLNPLHALFPHNPSHASPYSPSSRAQLNALYIDVEAVPDFTDCDAAQARVRSRAFQARLVALRESELVDYPGVATAKHEIMGLLHARFLLRPTHDPEMQALQRFREQGGHALHQHAIFDALQAHLHQRDPQIWGWPEWPPELRDPGSPEVARFVSEHGERVAYYEYLQWQAARQLDEVSRQCKAQAMPIGLYLDLAVSVDRGGSDTWRHQDAFALAASVGAPPDFHNRNGQDWGLPPLRPDRLRDSRYAVFIEALRANMRSAGALRIDHVMMLMRLFWIPPGGSAKAGAYVHYPVEDLLSILALESHRHRCLVVGEDLGTVPDEMRDAMRRYGVLSYRLLYFERDAQGNFKPPNDYPRDAVVAVSTHDLPTLAAWWSAGDLNARLDLGLYADPAAFEAQWRERGDDRSHLLQALQRHSPDALAPGAEAPSRLTPALAGAAHDFLASTPAAIMVVQLEDMLDQSAQANMPGTTIEHPNWQRKYALPLDRIWRSPLARQLGATLGRTRPRDDAQAAAVQAAVQRTRIPRATYRLQLHKDFSFDDAARVVPYLAALGVSHVYCSPIHRARPGSLHGYDVVAHDQVNPELGGMPAFGRFTRVLQAHGMGQLIDLVPNHMGVLGGDNAWWNDVLENGVDSRFARHFDIDWHSATPGLAGKVLVPVLGDHYAKVLERGELKLQWDESLHKPRLCYFDHCFPLATGSLPASLRADGDRGALDAPAIADAINRFNRPEGRNALHALLELQAYRLAYWRAAADEINYRRFFDVNELAALRTEREDVFEATHALALDLAARGWVEGLRIDHPDGLLDPAAYFDRLQEGYGALIDAPTGERPLYVVAEKIAAPHEDVPVSWAVHGTTGYRFANVANGVLVDHRAAGRIREIWREFTGLAADFSEVVYQARREVATGTLASDLEVLANALLRIAKADRRTRDHTLNALREVIATVAACMSVYRTYNGESASPQDVRFVSEAIDAARERLALPDESVFAFVRDALLGRVAPGSSPALHHATRQFARRFQQYSAPVAAKGVEDTAFYRYFPLSALNEVGGEPEHIGMTVDEFHVASTDRQRRWPQTMLATSTHDNKRSEDVRLRIDVLSELPELWALALRQWNILNAPLRGPVSAAHEYLLYQTLLGTLPVGGLQDGAMESYADRIVAYMCKAAREGKTGTSWTRPDAAYEGALEHLIREALQQRTDNAFLSELHAFATRLDRHAAQNALSLAILKFTSPGVPDIYQGCELVDLSLVDPDNRRPVDYARREAALASLRAVSESEAVHEAVKALVAKPADGHAKLWTIWRLLGLRREVPDLFRDGSYEPLEVHGHAAQHLVAYMRRYQGRVLVVVVVRLFAVFENTHGTMDAASWKDTRIVLPPDACATTFDNPIAGTRHAVAESGDLQAAELLAHLPGAVLVSAAP